MVLLWHSNIMEKFDIKVSFSQKVYRLKTFYNVFGRNLGGHSTFFLHFKNIQDINKNNFKILVIKQNVRVLHSYSYIIWGPS